LLFSIICVDAHGQQDTAKPDKEEVAALREKAFKVLDSVAGQVNTLQSAENRARIGYNLVYSLWEHDEDRARSLLRLVQEDIKTELQKRTSPGSDHQSLAVFLKLRHDTTERVAKLDPEAAFEFLKATEPVFDGPAPEPMRSNEQALQLGLAKRLASSNPDIALKLGRRTLERGFEYDLISLLFRLGRKNEQQANTLFKEIVDKLGGSDALNDWNTRYFAQGLIRGFTPPVANESTYRELVGIFVTKALENGCGNRIPDDDERAGFCRWVAANIPLSARYDSRVARLKHWGTNDEYSENFSINFQEIDELLQADAFDELVEFAEKHPAMQEIIYQRLIHRAIYNEDFDRARKLIERFIAHPGKRKEMLSLIDAREGKLTVGMDEKLAEIRKRLEELPTDIGRAWFLMDHASRMGRVDRKVGLKLIGQAGEIVETLKPGSEQTRLRLAMATLYCLEKDERGFGLMESLVPKLNELVEMAVKLDGYDTNYLRDGEWNMSGNGSVGGLLTGLSQSAEYFAWFDFDRAMVLASQFERPEIRMMAHLKLAQSILSGPPKRPRSY
jgi:hypothetical protein